MLLNARAAGVPRLANGKQSKKIIENLARLSRPYGTEVNYKDGFGVINPYQFL
jgi:hypothetical protein